MLSIPLVVKISHRTRSCFFLHTFNASVARACGYQMVLARYFLLLRVPTKASAHTLGFGDTWRKVHFIMYLSRLRFFFVSLYSG